MNQLFTWLLNLTNVFAQFSSWLTTPLQYFNISPLEMFTVGGLTALISIHLVKLFL